MRTRTLAALCVGWLLVMLTMGANASHIGEDLTLDQQAVTSTNQLLGALRQYETAAATQKAAALQRLTDLAVQRRDRMIALLERNPKLAALRVLPDAVRNRLPAQAQAQVEREVGIAGVIQASVEDDFARGHSHTHFHLVDAAGQRFALGIANATERDMMAMVGKRASGTALQFDGHLLVRDKRNVQLAAADATTTTTTTITTLAAASAIQGTRNTLVIMANFSDKAIACTASDLQGRLFGASGSTMNVGYQQSSGNLLSFAGQVVGPYPINYLSTGSCDYNGWATAAKAAAQAAGVSLSGYQHISIATPSNSTCGWSGLASLGGSSSWIQSCGSTGVFSHELGHNLTFHHASTPTAEYGDGSDPMGGARVVQSNAANRVMAGWFGGGAVQDVSVGGSYAITAVESTAPTTPQTLRLFKPDTNEYYFVSLRQPMGVDSTNLSTSYQNTLNVHRATGTLPTRTYLVANIALGQSWSDTVNGIQLTHQGLSGAIANVGVTFGGAVCTRQAPTLTAEPASQTAAAGATRSYNVTVTNNNSSACPSSAFTIAQALPTGFTGTLGASSVTLAAGASSTVGWDVASGLSSAEATYTLTASASESAASNSSDVHASYVVFNDTTAPTLAITSPADGAVLSAGRIGIAATASDASGVGVVEFYVDGKLIASDTSAPYGATWNARKAVKGLHTLRVRAVDATGNASEQSISVTLQ